MLICIPNVLTQEQVQFCREQLAQAEWVDGKVTTGVQSATVKANQQVEQNSPIAKQLGEMITRTLSNLPRSSLEKFGCGHISHNTEKSSQVILSHRVL